MAFTIRKEEYFYSTVVDQPGEAYKILTQLEDSGFVAVSKSFENKKPVSRYMLTQKGRKAFGIYVERLEKLIKK